MKLLYQNTDITDSVQIRRADLIDNAGDRLDSLEVEVNDPQGLWSSWAPEKNHLIRTNQNGFDSGLMYLDEIIQTRGVVIFKALPVKQEAKTERTQAWENVRFMELAQEVAGRWGLTVQTFGMENNHYARLDQVNKTDFAFLSSLCILESGALKVSNGKLILFNQAYMESLSPAKTITYDDIDGDFCFINKSSEIYGSCRITCNDIDYTFTKGSGPTLRTSELVANSIGEAQRFGKGLLRFKNRLEKTLAIITRYDPGIAAGNTIQISGLGLADGKYIAQQVVQRMIDGKTSLMLRGLLEGY